MKKVFREISARVERKSSMLAIKRRRSRRLGSASVAVSRLSSYPSLVKKQRVLPQLAPIATFRLDPAKQDILEASSSTRCRRSGLDQAKQLVSADQAFFLLLELDLAGASSDGELGSDRGEGVAGEAGRHVAETAAHRRASARVGVGG